MKKKTPLNSTEIFTKCKQTIFRALFFRILSDHAPLSVFISRHKEKPSLHVEQRYIGIPLTAFLRRTKDGWGRLVAIHKQEIVLRVYNAAVLERFLARRLIQREKTFVPRHSGSSIKLFIIFSLNNMLKKY